MKTQGQIEAAVCQGMSQFQQEYLGRGPKNIHAYLIGDGDVIFVRLQGALTTSEGQLVKSLAEVPEKTLAMALSGDRGRDLIKNVRSHLIETAQPLMYALISDITGVKVVSLHHDVSTVTGEEIVVFTLAEPCVTRLKKRWRQRRGPGSELSSRW